MELILNVAIQVSGVPAFLVTDCFRNNVVEPVLVIEILLRVVQLGIKREALSSIFVSVKKTHVWLTMTYTYA